MLGAIVRVYRLTQDPRHLEFAKYIARTGCSLSGDIFQGVLEGKTPAELIAQVSSPGGTTLAALTAFDDFGFEALIREAVLRCTKRAGELGQ